MATHRPWTRQHGDIMPPLLEIDLKQTRNYSQTNPKQVPTIVWELVRVCFEQGRHGVTILLGQKDTIILLYLVKLFYVSDK